MPEVAIVGAGPVGVLLAILLADRGIEAAVFEARSGESSHSRAIGIHPPALAVLERAGVAQRLIADGVTIENGSAFCEGEKLGSLSFRIAGASHPFILAVPQQRTQAALDSALLQRSPDAVRRGCRVRRLSHAGGSLLVHHEGGTDSARLVVGADGARSVVRRDAHARVRKRLYADSYLMGDFADDSRFGREAVLFLEPEGVVESFPLPGRTRRWVAHWNGCARPLTADALAAEVASRTGETIDPGTVSMLSGFSPRRALAHRMAGPGVLLIGDAAHEVSPIGGQGMNLGWLDAAAIVEPITRFLATDDDAQLREAVERRRRAAGRAATLAEINMALGRPRSGRSLVARNALVRGATRVGAHVAIARAFSMQW
ncbi:NAD(P)/FAD-dependent oxidoreductase [Okibacterium endophyticum]